MFHTYNGTGKDCLSVSIRAVAFFFFPFRRLSFARTLFNLIIITNDDYYKNTRIKLFASNVSNIWHWLSTE